MRQSLVPVLLLASVAFSSSNILPNLPINELKEPLDLDGQQNDNTFSNRFQIRNILNDIIFKVSDGAEDRTDLQNSLQGIYDTDKDQAEDSIDRKENYNGEGFRTEQWHNYPRQLDRLHKYLYIHRKANKRNLDPDDDDDIEETTAETHDNNLNDLTMNGLDSKDNIAITTPLLILKIGLARLNNDIANQPPTPASAELDATNVKRKVEEEQLLDNELNPAFNLMKVKRESVISPEYGDEAQQLTNGNSVVKKRIFSLWSRLQGLNHKGHALHHRRHLYALYGLPDADGNGVLTAETRATLMRPPGSPLRWG